MAIAEPTFTVDLLERLLKNSVDPDPAKRLAKQQTYAKILDSALSATKASSKDHPYSQYRKTGGNLKYSNPSKACPLAVKDFCRKWLGGINESSRPYYTTPPPANASYYELDFPTTKVMLGASRIKSSLNSNTPVLVGLIRGHGSKIGKVGGKYVPYHYVGIVGYGGNTFLYIDPWPGGQSKAMYKLVARNMMGYIVLKARLGKISQSVLSADDLVVAESTSSGLVRGGIVMTGP